jgi:putative Mn2+ efflux pump MntP
MEPSVWVLAVSLAADAMAVCIAWAIGAAAREKPDGARESVKPTQSLRPGLWLPLAFGVFQSGMAGGGWLIGDAAGALLHEALRWVAAGLLLIIGLKMLLHRADRADPDSEAPTRSLTARLLLVLALATSMDALAAGVGLNALTEQPLIALIPIGVVTAALSLAGYRFGAKLGLRVGLWGTRLGGAMLLLLAAKAAFL